MGDKVGACMISGKTPDIQSQESGTAQRTWCIFTGHVCVGRSACDIVCVKGHVSACDMFVW